MFAQAGSLLDQIVYAMPEILNRHWTELAWSGVVYYALRFVWRWGVLP